jgi:hypothetical protein
MMIWKNSVLSVTIFTKFRHYRPDIIKTRPLLFHIHRYHPIELKFHFVGKTREKIRPLMRPLPNYWLLWQSNACWMDGRLISQILLEKDTLHHVTFDVLYYYYQYSTLPTHVHLLSCRAPRLVFVFILPIACPFISFQFLPRVPLAVINWWEGVGCSPNCRGMHNYRIDTLKPVYST